MSLIIFALLKKVVTLPSVSELSSELSSSEENHLLVISEERCLLGSS